MCICGFKTNSATVSREQKGPITKTGDGVLVILLLLSFPTANAQSWYAELQQSEYCSLLRCISVLAAVTHSEY